MFKLWAKEIKNSKMIRDITVTDDSKETRTHKVFNAIDKVCYEFDLSRPIWLDGNVSEFQRHSKTRFRPDSFIDGIDFDYLDIEIIEEDHIWE